jgi:YHS domain-containing protein
MAITTQCEYGAFLEISEWGLCCSVSFIEKEKIVWCDGAHALAHKGKIYFFNSDDEKNAFAKNPAKFLQFSPPEFQHLKIFVLGPPLSGKSVVSKLLGEHFKINVISAEKLLEQEISYNKQRATEVRIFQYEKPDTLYRWKPSGKVAKACQKVCTLVW